MIHQTYSRTSASTSMAVSATMLDAHGVDMEAFRRDRQGVMIVELRGAEWATVSLLSLCGCWCLRDYLCWKQSVHGVCCLRLSVMI